MSRFKRFVNSLVSGYLLIGANILFTLASVPLALHYLSKEQFGLWALVTQVCNFNLLLIDLGMSGALARILIDHKDDQSSTAYGTVIQTGFLVLVAQGVVLAAVGGVISYWLPQWMDVPQEYWRVFRILVIWQCVLLALSLVTRIAAFILQAHQRYDVSNYSILGSLVINFGVLWAGFASNQGLYSLLLGAGAASLSSGLFSLWQTYRLRLFPAKDRWGRPNWITFKELFFYGTDMFLISVGHQLVTASQVPVITRTLGLETAAVWSIATKLFTLSQQLFSGLVGVSAAAFSEMMVRGERVRLQTRFRDLVILGVSVSAALGVTMALCNHAFLKIWTHDRISWAIENDVLMAISLVVYASTRCHIWLACMTKKIGAMKYVYFAEGAAFVCLGLVIAPHFGLTGVILSGIITNLLFSGIYGIRRTAEYLDVKAREILFQWPRPGALVFLSSMMAAVGLWFATRSLATLAQLLVCGPLMGIIAGICLWRFGLSEGLRAEGLARLRQLRARFWGGV